MTTVSKTRKLVGTAMLAAVSVVLMFLAFPVPLMPSFIKLDLAELPALIGAFAYGPLAGAAVCLVKNLVSLMKSSSGGVDTLCNFLLGVLFVVPAGLIYKKNRTRKGALIGSLVGAATMAIVSMCPMEAKYIQIPDVVSWNHYFGWYGGDTTMNGPWFDEFHAKYPNIPVGISEYGCEALNWHTSKPMQGDYTEEYQAFYHEELIKQIAERITGKPQKLARSGRKVANVIYRDGPQIDTIQSV